ncbi:MAG: hypothetical protein ACJ8FC_03515 [Sphingomicrobium sp.]
MLKLGAGLLAGALLAATLSLSPGSAAAQPKKATRAPPPPAPAPPAVAPPARAPAYAPPPQPYRQVTQPMAVHEPESMTKILSERQKQCRKQYNCLMTGPCQPCLGQ